MVSCRRISELHLGLHSVNVFAADKVMADNRDLIQVILQRFTPIIAQQRLQEPQVFGRSRDEPLNDKTDSKSVVPKSNLKKPIIYQTYSQDRIL